MPAAIAPSRPRPRRPGAASGRARSSCRATGGRGTRIETSLPHNGASFGIGTLDERFHGIDHIRASLSFRGTAKRSGAVSPESIATDRDYGFRFLGLHFVSASPRNDADMIRTLETT